MEHTAIIISLALITIIAIIWRLSTKQTENFATSPRTQEIYEISRDLFDKTNGEISYSEYKLSLNNANPVLYADARRLWKEGKLSTDEIEKILYNNHITMRLLIFSLIVIIVTLVIYLVYSRKQTKQTKKRRSTLSVPRNIFNIGRNASAELRREVFDRARNQYMNVLTELIPHEAVTDNNIGFIIDNAAEFAFDGGRLMNDVLLTHIIDIPLANMAEQRRDDIIQERQTSVRVIDNQKLKKCLFNIM